MKSVYNQDVMNRILVGLGCTIGGLTLVALCIYYVKCKCFK